MGKKVAKKHKIMFMVKIKAKISGLQQEADFLLAT